jgi:hypothetical protein
VVFAVGGEQDLDFVEEGRVDQRRVRGLVLLAAEVDLGSSVGTEAT